MLYDCYQTKLVTFDFHARVKLSTRAEALRALVLVAASMLKAVLLADQRHSCQPIRSMAASKTQRHGC